RRHTRCLSDWSSDVCSSDLQSFLAALNLLGQTRVLATENGSPSVPDLKGFNGEPKKWREIAPLVWRNIGGPDRIAAKIENDRVRSEERRVGKECRAWGSE